MSLDIFANSLQFSGAGTLENPIRICWTVHKLNDGLQLSLMQWSLPRFIDFSIVYAQDEIHTAHEKFFFVWYGSHDIFAKQMFQNQHTNVGMTSM